MSEKKNAANMKAIKKASFYCSTRGFSGKLKPKNRCVQPSDGQILISGPFSPFCAKWNRTSRNENSVTESQI